MAYLVANIPPIECFVRKEYLYDLTPDPEFPGKLQGQGEYAHAIWVSVKSIRGKALYIESLLTEYGALYDKLPLSAYVWRTNIDQKDLLPLDNLEIWDAFSYHISVIRKETLKECRVAYFGKDKVLHHGEYMFTVDSCHSEPNELNLSLSETPNEHKSFNFIKLDNGQFAAQPNNRCKWFDQSLISSETKSANFKVSTHEFSVEDNPKWSANHGDGTTWQYELKESKPKVGQEEK
jgi:hypothetical protein